MFEAELMALVDRLAYPEKYTDTKGWFHGDGPFERYADELQESAIALMKRIREG